MYPDNLGLAAALATLGKLTADELTDLIDYVEYFFLDRDGILIRRKGKPTFVSEYNKFPQNEYEPTEAVAAALSEIEPLSNDDQNIVIKTATMLRDALAPVILRRVNKETGEVIEPRGTIQAKDIPKPRYNLAGQYVRTDHYQYLYLRQWAVRGGKNRDEKRLTNKYLGCPRLAHQLYRYQHHESPDHDPELAQRLAGMILDAHYTGSLNALEGRAPINFENEASGNITPDTLDDAE